MQTGLCRTWSSRLISVFELVKFLKFSSVKLLDDDVKTGLCRTLSERLIRVFVFSLVSQVVRSVNLVIGHAKCVIVLSYLKM